MACRTSASSGGTWMSSPAPLRAATRQGSCHLGPGHHREGWPPPRGRIQEHVGNQCGQASCTQRTLTGLSPLEASLGLTGAWAARTQTHEHPGGCVPLCPRCGADRRRLPVRDRLAVHPPHCHPVRVWDPPSHLLSLPTALLPGSPTMK